jgi:uncharacterized Fe-S cluster protein YjdI
MKPKIACAPNGPYLVSDVPNLPQGAALCRCGGSSNKPFCDGTHRKNGFSDRNSADPGKNKRETYAGKRITIYDNRAICAHAGVCTDGLASVFRYGEEPWLVPDGDAVDKIMETIRRCPSSARR